MNCTMQNINLTTVTVQQPGPPATYEQQVAMTIVIGILGIWTTFGNLLTIAAILSFKTMRTNSNMFILSLAFSDLISGLIASPLWLYRRTWGFYPWEWGQFACRLYWGVDETTSYCTAMHIASFAIWRYIAVKFPLTMMKINLWHVQVWLGVVWLIAIIFGGAIYNIYFESIEKPQDGGVYSAWPMCSINYRDNG